MTTETSFQEHRRLRHRRLNYTLLIANSALFVGDLVISIMTGTLWTPLALTARALNLLAVACCTALIVRSRPVPPRPDYAKIARLKAELGLEPTVSTGPLMPITPAERSLRRAVDAALARHEPAPGRTIFHDRFIRPGSRVVGWHETGRLPTGELWGKMGAITYLLDPSGAVVSDGYHRIFRRGGVLIGQRGALQEPVRIWRDESPEERT